jgi:F-box and leucine-rich repeat protein 10/11
MDPSLWRSMSFVQVRVSAAQLAGIARRQPLALGLEWCQLARRQLAWYVTHTHKNTYSYKYIFA